MYVLSAAASKVLSALTAGLEPGQSRKIDNAPGAFMPASIERLSQHRYSVTHYFESQGDLVPDPDCEFVRTATQQWLPAAIQHSTGQYVRAVELADDEQTPARWRQAALKDLVSFCNQWMCNISQQQRGLLAIRAAVAASTREAAASDTAPDA